MTKTVQIDASQPPQKVKFRKTGGSYSVIIPVALANSIGISDGDIVEMSRTESGGLLLETPHKRERKRYSLEELMNELPTIFELNEEQRAWEQMPPVGKEI